MNASLTIRYIGDENFSRRYLLERQDGKFWSGRRWVSAMSEARLYNKIANAQRAYHAIHNRRLRGKQRREFKMELAVTVRGSRRFSQDDLRRFLAHAIQISFDTAAAGDGPYGNFVIARPLLHTLDEYTLEQSRQPT